MEVRNFANLSEGQLTGIVNGGGVIVGGFCNSGAVLLRYLIK